MTVGSDRVLRVVLYGHGTVGHAVEQLLGQRPGLECCGFVNRRGVHDASGRLLSTDPAAGLATLAPDVVLHATTSLVDDILGELQLALRAGACVITTSEEMARPAPEHATSAELLDRTAKENGVTLVAVGVNPGFVADLLPVVLAQAAWNVERVVCRRVLDASVFAETVHRSLGLGFEPAVFDAAVRSGEIRGHLGFPESAGLICDAMGVTLDSVEQDLQPVLATRDYELGDWVLPAGTSAGVVHTATAYVEGREWISFDLSLHVSPEDVGWAPIDEISVIGEHPLHLTISPGTEAVRTTAARLVNSIGAVLRARNGLLAATELAPSPPNLGGIW